MNSKIIRIGNSKGIRIPKKLLEATSLGGDVILVAKGDSIVIKPAPKGVDESVLLSYSSLASDWNSPEEDKAWQDLQ